MKFLACLFGLAVLAATAKMPGFDTYICELSIQDGLVSIGELKPLTNRPEYDNQPQFLADGSSLLYTSARLKGGQEQTDIILISLLTQESINLTDSIASEY